MAFGSFTWPSLGDLMKLPHSRRIAIAGSLVVVALLAGSMPILRAQQRSCVVPHYAKFVDGNRYISSFFRERHGRRVQLVIGERHLRDLTGKRIFELAFRKDLRNTEVYDLLKGAVQVRMRVLASFSDANPRSPSLVFAKNHDAAVEV